MNLLYPMAFLIFYIFGLGILNFLVRNNAVKNKDLSVKYFKTFQTNADIPEKIVRFGRHYDNQFQLPTFFFITCLTCLVLKQQSGVLVLTSWAFVLSRLCHSYFHLGSNSIPYRAIAYISGWFFILLIWVFLFLQSLG